jgi:hypothetical protein
LARATIGSERARRVEARLTLLSERTGMFAGHHRLYQPDVTSQVCDCRADLSADGFVNGVDLAIVLSNWGVVGSSADLTGDDTVDGADLGIILAAWGTCPSS